MVEESKEYYEKIEKLRFSFFRERTLNYRLKVIIGTAKSKEREFKDAFGVEGSEWRSSGNIDFEIAAPGKKTGTIWMIDDTVLIVTPFFGGRNGLNKDIHLQILAKQVREILAVHA